MAAISSFDVILPIQEFLSSKEAPCRVEPFHLGWNPRTSAWPPDKHIAAVCT
jgi:hypothetical protein